MLSTYLGHVEPANTYWYLSAVPELMQPPDALLAFSTSSGYPEQINPEALRDKRSGTRSA